MFGKLQQVYSESNALTEHGDITVYLPEKELHYKVFAAVPYDNRHILYTYDFTSKRRYNAFLNSISMCVRSVRSTVQMCPLPQRINCLSCPPASRAIHTDDFSSLQNASMRSNNKWCLITRLGKEVLTMKKIVVILSAILLVGCSCCAVFCCQLYP